MSTPADARDRTRKQCVDVLDELEAANAQTQKAIAIARAERERAENSDDDLVVTAEQYRGRLAEFAGLAEALSGAERTAIFGLLGLILTNHGATNRVPRSVGCGDDAPRMIAVQMIAVQGPALRAIREARGRKIVELAQRVGVDRSFITNVETGQLRRIDAEIYTSILRELRISDHRALMANPFDGARP